jgi:hypothetical protein
MPVRAAAGSELIREKTINESVDAFANAMEFLARTI